MHKLEVPGLQATYLWFNSFSQLDLATLICLNNSATKKTLDQVCVVSLASCFFKCKKWVCHGQSERDPKFFAHFHMHLINACGKVQLFHIDPSFWKFWMLHCLSTMPGRGQIDDIYRKLVKQASTGQKSLKGKVMA